MRLDINEINHQYIIRIVVFSLFLYKRHIRKPDIFKLSVIAFCKKKIHWKIDLKLDTGEFIEKELQRDILLEEILNGVKSNSFRYVTVEFLTPMKEMKMKIDLEDEDKYSNFLYL